MIFPQIDTFYLQKVTNKMYVFPYLSRTKCLIKPLCTNFAIVLYMNLKKSCIFAPRFIDYFLNESGDIIDNK
jgi:hypothetical protein